MLVTFSGGSESSPEDGLLKWINLGVVWGLLLLLFPWWELFFFDSLMDRGGGGGGWGAVGRVGQAL